MMVIASVVAGSSIALIKDGPVVIVTCFVMLALVALAFISAPSALVVLVAAGRTGIGPLNGTLLDVALFTALGLALASVIRAPNHKVLQSLKQPIAALHLVTVAIVVIGFINTSSYAYAEEKTFRVLIYGICFLIIPIVYLPDTTSVGRFFLAFIIFANIMGVVALLWTLQNTSLGSIQRINAPSGGPITLARILAFGSISCMTMAMAYRRYRVIASLDAVLLMVLAFLTGSRGPAIFLMIVLVAMPSIALINSKTREIAPRIIVALIALGIVAVPIWSYANSLNMPVFRRFDLLTQDDRGDSVDTRVDYYRIATELSRENSWQGYGTGGWAVTMGEGDVIHYPHNIFLEILFEQGALGLAFFVAFVLAVVVTSVRMLSRSNDSIRDSAMRLGVLSCFVFALLAAQTSGDLYDNRAIWFFGGLILALSTVRQAARTNRDPRTSPRGASNVGPTLAVTRW